MIRLNIQMFAKSATYREAYRKSQAIKKMNEELKQRKEEETKSEGNTRKSAKGEAVTAVDARSNYQVFVYENGKERPYTDSAGNYVFRTGAKIAEKMIYNKNRDGWESKAQIKASRGTGQKIRKYIVRRVR